MPTVQGSAVEGPFVRDGVQVQVTCVAVSEVSRRFSENFKEKFKMLWKK